MVIAGLEWANPRFSKGLNHVKSPLRLKSEPVVASGICKFSVAQT